MSDSIALMWPPSIDSEMDVAGSADVHVGAATASLSNLAPTQRVRRRVVSTV
jgi:hypothetical protein